MSESIALSKADKLSEQTTLFVDLDSTLVNTDTLLECVLSSIRQPWKLLRALLVLRKGKAALKAEIAAIVDIQPALLPFNQEFVALLRAESTAGRRLVLATGADRKIALAVAEHLGLFDDVIASDGVVNLTGRTKLSAIRRLIGDAPFSYAGDDRKDLPIWQDARSAILVNTAPSVARAAAETTSIEATFPASSAWPEALLRAIRPYQWSKNLLVFVPILTARAADNVAAWGMAALMFVAFSCAASGMYLINDLLDLAADRQHPRKRLRPFAGGTLPLHIGLIAAPLLLLGGLTLGWITGTLGIILFYLLSSTAYSFYLKSQPLIDVFLLAGLYTLRLFGGGEATGYHVSLWLLAFGSFLFLSLAIMKRVSELITLAGSEGDGAAGRAYALTDVNILQVMGVASSFVASIVLALYVQSELNPGASHYPTLSWMLVPLMLFWQCRIWLATARGYMHDDPIVFAASDWVSWLVAICSSVVLLFGPRIVL